MYHCEIRHQFAYNSTNNGKKTQSSKNLQHKTIFLSVIQDVKVYAAVCENVFHQKILYCIENHILVTLNYTMPQATYNRIDNDMWFLKF